MIRLVRVRAPRKPLRRRRTTVVLDANMQTERLATKSKVVQSIATCISPDVYMLSGSTNLVQTDRDDFYSEDKVLFDAFKVHGLPGSEMLKLVLEFVLGSFSDY